MNFIKEKVNIWDYLARTDKPIFIYGMGDGAEKILRVFEEYHIPTAGFFASDEFVRGHSFKGHLVHKLSDIEAQVEDLIVVLAFGAGYLSLYDKVHDIAKRHELYAPDVPVAGSGLFTYEYAMEHAEEIEKVYSLLADDLSRRTFEDIINFKISGKIEYLDDCTADEDEINSLIPLSDNEHYCDLGAYNGDTVGEFLRLTGGKYAHITAVEPDKRNFRKLSANVTGENITLINAAAWDSDGETEFSVQKSRGSSTADTASQKRAEKAIVIPTMTVDTAAPDATLIKLDVEGAERRAIHGAQNAVKNGAQIICALYHRNEDIFDLPLLIHSLNPELKLYIRHKMYIPAWETNLYGINN